MLWVNSQNPILKNFLWFQSADNRAKFFGPRGSKINKITRENGAMSDDSGHWSRWINPNESKRCKFWNFFKFSLIQMQISRNDFVNNNH